MAFRAIQMPEADFLPSKLILIPFATQCWAQYSQPDHQLLRSVASPAVRWAYGPARVEQSQAMHVMKKTRTLLSWPFLVFKCQVANESYTKA